MYEEIQLNLLADLGSIKRLFEKHIPAEVLNAYRLPANPDDQIIVGMSGGADSSVLGLFVAAYLCPIYRNITFMFTDTGAEPESCHETLSAFEHMTFQEVKRIIPEHDFFEAIDKANGFLPSSKQRWCTNLLKIKPLKDFIETNFEGACWNLAGIRADEADREGITMMHNMESDGKSNFPFVSLGINKEMVFDILHRSIGIPSTYRYRSRSGCYTCFFQRNQEIIGMMFNDPAHFLQTEALEKLTDSDKERFSTLDNFMTTHGLNVPPFVDIRTKDSAEVTPYKRITTKAGPDSIDDLFGGDSKDVTEIFVAHAVYVEPKLSLFSNGTFTPGTYGTEFITFSTSLTGLNTSLANYYQFKKTTPNPVHDFGQMKIIISHLTFPKGLIDTAPPSADSYTWKTNIAYKQLRHIVTHAMATMTESYCITEIERNERISEETNSLQVFLQAEDNIERHQDAMLLVDPSRTGSVRWQGLYHPKTVNTKAKAVQFDLEGFYEPATPVKAKKGKNLEYDNVPKACIICSL